MASSIRGGGLVIHHQRANDLSLTKHPHLVFEQTSHLPRSDSPRQKSGHHLEILKGLHVEPCHFLYFVIETLKKKSLRTKGKHLARCLQP